MSCSYLCSCISSVRHPLNTLFVSILVSSFLDPRVNRDRQYIEDLKITINKLYSIVAFFPERCIGNHDILFSDLTFVNGQTQKR